MKLPFALLGMAWLASVRAEEKSSAWQLDPQPALVPGSIGEWDDFAIGSVSVVKVGDQWTMLYEGVGFSEDGNAHAFGMAESPDGIKWKKHAANLVFAPAEHEWEMINSPCITKWQGSWLALYVVTRSLRFEEKSAEDFGLPRHWACLAWSADGLNWEFLRKVEGITLERTRDALPRPCLYADGNTLHLWWIGLGETDEPALLHSVSRDGRTWSKPNHQLTRDIDARRMACARVQPSGDYYILTYVAIDEKDGPRLVTKVSQNARSWTAAGPPELALPACYKTSVGWEQAAPSIVFTTQGARAFFIDLRYAKASDDPDPRRDATCGAVMRTAFWKKPHEQEQE